MFYKVVIELHIDPENYDLAHSDGEFDLEDIVIDELMDLCRSDILSACEIEKVEGEENE